MMYKIRGEKPLSILCMVLCCKRAEKPVSMILVLESGVQSGGGGGLDLEIAYIYFGRF